MMAIELFFIAQLHASYMPVMFKPKWEHSYAYCYPQNAPL